MQWRGAMAAGAWLLFALAYWGAVQKLSVVERAQSPVELLVSLPKSAQVLLAAGDRHLAANLSGFRVLVAATARMRADDYAVQARLQQDVSWFNPAHEDNYYIAANILPWNGHLDAAQGVLRRATAARTNDWQPAFYLGFHYYHFLKDPAEGARWLLTAAPRATSQQDRWSLENLAAQWLERGYKTATAAAMVDAMAENAPAGAFRNYLKARATRLHDLVRLRELTTIFRERTGRSPAALEDLVTAGLIGRIPEDPLGEGFSLDREGMPVFKAPQAK